MPHDGKTIKSQTAHGLDLITSHFLLGIPLMLATFG